MRTTLLEGQRQAGAAREEQVQLRAARGRAARRGRRRRRPRARRCPARAGRRALPNAETSASTGPSRLEVGASHAFATASSTRAGSVSGTRSTQRTPSNSGASALTAAHASRVLPTPPGPTAVTTRSSADGALQRGQLPGAADERGQRGRRSRPQPPRPGGVRVHDGVPDQGRWSGRASLRRRDATWLSTVRTEMKSRAPDLLVRQLPAQQGQHLTLPGRRRACPSPQCDPASGPHAGTSPRLRGRGPGWLRMWRHRPEATV